MTLNFTFTKEDYITFSTYTYQKLCKSNNKPVKVIVNMLIWCVLTIVFLTLFRMAGARFGGFDVSSAVLTAIPFVVFIVTVLLHQMRFRRNAMPDENGIVLGNKRLELTQEGIVEHSEFAQCKYKWAALQGVDEHQGNLYLFIDNSIAVVIPKTAFISEQERVDFNTKLASLQG